MPRTSHKRNFQNAAKNAQNKRKKGGGKKEKIHSGKIETDRVGRAEKFHGTTMARAVVEGFFLVSYISVNGHAVAIARVECPVADCADLSVCNLLQGIGKRSLFHGCLRSTYFPGYVSVFMRAFPQPRTIL